MKKVFFLKYRANPPKVSCILAALGRPLFYAEIWPVLRGKYCKGTVNQYVKFEI